MNRLIGSGLLVLTLCLSFVSSYADKPPVPKPLAERVDLATHVFVGRAKSVQACQMVDGKMQDVIPEPTHTSSGVAIELEVDIEESLFPVTGESPKTVKIIFAPGIVSISDLRKAFLGESFVYLTQIKFFGGETFFLPSYPWHLVEKLSAKEAISAALEKRIAR